MWQAPLFTFFTIRRWFRSIFEHPFHVCIRHIEEIVHVEVLHHNYTYHSCQPGETPTSFYRDLQQWTPSLAWMTECTLIPPFFFPVFGWRPTPLKITLENSVIVVESMILSFSPIPQSHDTGCPKKRVLLLMLSGSWCKSKDNKKDCYLGRSVSPKFVSSSKV